MHYLIDSDGLMLKPTRHNDPLNVLAPDSLIKDGHVLFNKQGPEVVHQFYVATVDEPAMWLLLVVFL